MRVRVDGEMHEVTEEFNLEKNKKHNIEIVVDRIVVSDKSRSRLFDRLKRPSFSGRLCDCRCDWWGRTSLQRAPFMSDLWIHGGRIRASSLLVQCAVWSVSECDGLGSKLEVDLDLIVPDKT